MKRLLTIKELKEVIDRWYTGNSPDAPWSAVKKDLARRIRTAQIEKFEEDE